MRLKKKWITIHVLNQHVFFNIMRIQQLIKSGRGTKKNKATSALRKNPQLRGTCVKIFTMSPRKPNSAIRKVARVQLSNNLFITAYIRGEGHSLQEHSSVLVQGGRAKDLPGVKFKIIRGALDCGGVLNRKTSRSKYGVKASKLFLRM